MDQALVNRTRGEKQKADNSGKNVRIAAIYGAGLKSQKAECPVITKTQRVQLIEMKVRWARGWAKALSNG